MPFTLTICPYTWAKTFMLCVVYFVFVYSQDEKSVCICKSATPMTSRLYSENVALELSGGHNGQLFIHLYLTFLRRIRRRRLILIDDERRVLLLGDAHVVAGVVLLHYVPRSGIEQYRFLVEFGQFGGSHADKSDAIPMAKWEQRNF